jgi:MFS family permease
LFGRRSMVITGLVVFTAASIAGGLAQNPLLLVTSRVGQGIGAALVASAALFLITTGFAEGPARTRALGMYGATASIGFVSGLVLGGVLVEFSSLRSVFLVNVPVGVAAVLLAPKLLRESRQVRRFGHPRVDAGGAPLVTIAVAAVVFAVSQGTVLGRSSPRRGGCAVASRVSDGCLRLRGEPSSRSADPHEPARAAQPAPEACLPCC